MTTLFSEWPLGKEGEDSNGGTASVRGGRARPTRALPTVVIDSDPATAITISTTGVLDRHSRASVTVTTVARRAIPTGPPRSVNHVATCSFSGVLRLIAALRAGRSSPVTP